MPTLIMGFSKKETEVHVGDYDNTSQTGPARRTVRRERPKVETNP